MLRVGNMVHLVGNTATEPSASLAPRAIHRRFGYVGPGVALVVAGFLAIAVWAWNRSAEQRAVRDLPAQERQALYERTFATIQIPCGLEKRASGLERFCREQAQFILKFPECDAACTALARQNLGMPTK